MVDESNLQSNNLEKESAVDSPEKESVEKEKTPEEKRRENIKKLTEKARHFIDEKKAKKREEELMKQLTEKPKDIEVNDEDEDVKTFDIKQETKKKKGFIESIQDKLILRKFKKAGIADPQKALEFYEYIKKNVDPKFDARYEYRIDQIKKTFETVGDPIAFYEKAREVVDIDRMIDPSSSMDLGALIKDPDFSRKIDVLKLMKENLDMEISSYGIHDLCRGEIINNATPENINRIAELSITVGEKISSYDIDGLLKTVSKDDIFPSVKSIAAERGIRYWIFINDLAYKLEGINKDGLLDDVAVCGGLNMDVTDVITGLSGSNEELRKKSVDSLKSLEVGKMSEDAEFRQFSDDFSVLAGRKFNLAEFQYVEKLYSENKEDALAFFEALRSVDALKGDADGNFNIRDFYNKLAQWQDKADGNWRDHTECYWAMLDDGFREYASKFDKLDLNKKGKGGWNVEKISQQAFTYVENKEFVEAIEAEGGKELFDFFLEKEIDPQWEMGFFKYPGAATVLKKLDKFILIGEGWNLRDILDLCENEEDAKKLIDFLEKTDAVGDGKDKFEVNRIFSLLRLSKISNPSELKYFSKYRDFYLDSRTIDFIEKNPDEYIEITALLDDGYLDNVSGFTGKEILLNNLEKMMSIPRDKRGIYKEVLKQINNSPSQEIQKIKYELVGQLLETSDPEQAYRKIENIFIKNNLPLVGKIFKIFAVLYPPEKIGMILNKDRSSPHLVEAKTRRRYMTIYNDLINIHIKSGNRSLRDYLQTFQNEKNGENVFDKFDADGLSGLGPDEIKRIEFLLKRSRTLFENSQKGSKLSQEDLAVEGDLEEQYAKLREDLGVKEGQKITERISQMFLAPAGFSSVEDALAVMKESKSTAHQRGLDSVSRSIDGQLEISEGDLLKGVDVQHINNILQNGSVSVEYLGANSDNDATPFDTDVSRVLSGDSINGFSGVIENSLAKDYGKMLFCMKNRGQWQETSAGNMDGYDPAKIELFKTGVTGERHYGIRTGFPTTEIDFMVAKKDLAENKKNIENVYFEIAKNGWYIPVVDTDGKIIFTLEMYEEYRKSFDGLDNFEGNPLGIEDVKSGDRNFDDISRLMRELPQDRENVREINARITDIISGVLERNGINLKDKWDTGIIGAEIMNTGSTARHTNAPSDYDFDLILRLDNADMGKVSKITQELKAVFQGEDNQSHSDNNGGYQLRLKAATGIDGRPMDIDVGFVGKSEIVQFGSHDAVEDKLEWIMDNVGPDSYEQTVANIILTKKVLKEGGAYKKLEHGGIGGIGVENWILANGGNMLKAFETFYKAAHDESGQSISLDEFRKKYRILDPGINVKFNSHDNFVEILKETGYQAMLRTIGEYLNQ